jgi:hypothetical protein
MFLVVRADGRYWDGHGWGVRGREFLSVASATRSLHEEGENTEDAKILDINTDNDTT